MTLKAKTEDLEAFVAVVDAGSFSAAANLGDGQVARVSRAISRLEKTLSVTLFNRTTLRIELTEEGQLFLSFVREGINTLEKGEEALRLLHRAPSGKLRIDAASPFVLHQLAPLLKGFSQEYPAIRLEITSNEGIIDLLEHKTDIAIRIGELPDSNLHARKLGSSPLHIVASPGDLAEAGIPMDVLALAKHQLIGFTDAPHLNVWPLKEPQLLTFAISASSGETLRRLCLAGHGIALLSQFMIYKDLAAGRLVKLLDGQVLSPNRREVIQAVYYQNSAVSSRIQAFLDYISPRLVL